MAQKKIRAEPKNYNLIVAINAADSFLNLAKTYTSKLSKDINDANTQAANDFGGLISSATNCALAIELYLKSLRIIFKGYAPKTHQLWDLYKALPIGTKTSIEEIYSKKLKTKDPITAGVEVQIKCKGNTWEENSKKEETIDVKSALLRANNAFQNWRYIYELPEPNRTLTLNYDFQRLYLIGLILKRHIEAGLKLQANGIDFVDIRLEER